MNAAVTENVRMQAEALAPSGREIYGLLAVQGSIEMANVIVEVNWRTL
jgi:hypothetical protein